MELELGLGSGRNVEVLESVELGWTGPRERREAAKSGSRASREITTYHGTSAAMVSGESTGRYLHL